jgi:cholesterol transport system auxiliary component
MTTLLRFTLAAVLLSSVGALGGCAGAPSTPVATYDFGLASAAAADDPPLNAHVASVEVTAPAWLNGADITYRLAYQDAERVRVYNNSRWVAAPAELIRKYAQERITPAATDPARTASAAASGMAARRYRVQLELQEFSQVFRTPGASAAVVRVRARLFDLGLDMIVAERTFRLERDAPSANAHGAVHALSDASEAMLTEVFGWAAAQESTSARRASTADHSSAASIPVSSPTPAPGAGGSGANRPLASGPGGNGANRAPAPGPEGSGANAAVVLPDPQVCAFVVRLELGPLVWASTFDAKPEKVIDKLIALNSGPDLPDNLKKELYPWIREAVRIAYASGDATDKAKLLFVECAGSRPEEYLRAPESNFL